MVKQIVIEFQPLVRVIALRIRRRCPGQVRLDDLISAGNLGLLDAIRKFDPTQGVRFKTYAEFRIRGRILDELRAGDVLNRYQRELLTEIEKIRRELHQSLKRRPFDREVADVMGMELEKYQSIIAGIQNINVMSLTDHGSLSSSDRGTLKDIASKWDPIMDLIRNENAETLQEKINELPLRQQRALRLYFFDGLTMKQIGIKTSVSESRISQLIEAAITKLKISLGRANIKSFKDAI